MALAGREALLGAVGLFPFMKWGDAGLQGEVSRFKASVFPSAAQASRPIGTEGAGTLPSPRHLQG